MDTGALRAWVDESGSDRKADPGSYILAACIGRQDLEVDTRRQMQQLRLPAQAKLHWRDESQHRRTTIARTVAALDLEHLVVVRSRADHERPERRRRKCLEQLLYELVGRSVTDIVLESRGTADDRRDIEMLNALRGNRVLASTIRLTHRAGRTEPLLWIPDAVCGMVTSARTGDDTNQKQIEARLTLIEI